MVFKKSEYGHQFKVSTLVRNIPVYREHLNYRNQRRERECAHTPISWDGETASSSSGRDEVNVCMQPLSELVIHESDERHSSELDTSEDDDIAEEKKQSEGKDAVKDKKDDVIDVEIVKQDKALRKSAKEKLNKYVSKNNTDQCPVSKEALKKKCLGKTFVMPKQADDKLFVKRDRPCRPDRVPMEPTKKVPIQKVRPSSAPSKRSARKVEHSSGVFVNYGCGSDERTTGEKTTFNVRASSAVYPAALRAKKRNLQAIAKQIDKHCTDSAKEKHRYALFNAKRMREAAVWDTEYQRSFPAYKNTEYATSDRDPRRRKSMFLI